MANIMSDLLREFERRVAARWAYRMQARPPLRFPSEKQPPRLPTWPKSQPYVPKPDYKLRETHL